MRTSTSTLLQRFSRKYRLTIWIPHNQLNDEPRFFIESTWIPWTQDYCAAPTRRNVIEFVHDIFKRDDEDAEVDLYAEYMSEHPEQLDPALEDNILRYRGAAGFPSDCCEVSLQCWKRTELTSI